MSEPIAHLTSPDEQERMVAVRRYDILDTPPDGAFDRITAIAARLFDVPISIISIVDDDRIWFKSHRGLAVNEVGRDPGLCASAILSAEAYVLTDAKADPRSLANPLVAGEFGLRFYAGVPLRTHDGHNLGTLCVIDKSPRPVTQHQIDNLTDLAATVMDQLELRLAAKTAVAHARLMAREIDHRVMNSLQFISGMLSMQSRLAGASAAVAHLETAALRVAAVARVHQHFYFDQGDKISCIAFIKRLCADLSGILSVTIDVEGDEGYVPTTLILPIGLAVNELVTNAAKHGKGPIVVNYVNRLDAQCLSVRDQGPGLPADFDVEAKHGLGMTVIRSLARQLGGTVRAERNSADQGTCFKLSFKI